MNEVFTIGYSGFLFEDFIRVLKYYHINSVIDVRSQPYSKIHPEYNKEQLSSALRGVRIYYKNYRKEFGARQLDPFLYPNGYLDFTLFSKTTPFQEGMDRIINAMPLGYRFVFLCSEKDPITCHRCIMVARSFYQRNIEVKNILSDCTFETQEQIENRLVDLYFQDRDQLSLFEPQLPWDEMVKQSYKKQNEKIGYRLREDQEDLGDE